MASLRLFDVISSIPRSLLFFSVVLVLLKLLLALLFVFLLSFLLFSGLLLVLRTYKITLSSIPIHFLSFFISSKFSHEIILQVMLPHVYFQAFNEAYESALP